MISAVVLVNTRVGQENRVLASVKSLQEVQEANALWGVYDLMLKVKSNSIDTLKETMSGVRNVDGVSNTLTLMIIEQP